MNPNSRPAGTFRFGEFTFDSGSHLLLRNRVKLHLSPKAQQLLGLLLQARPRVLSREELYDALWPSTFVCDTNLAGIVNEVRRALGDDARVSRFIRTVHRFGYAFCGEVTTAIQASIAAATLVYGEHHRHSLSEGDNVIGRAHDCDVVIADATVSRRHAQITVRGGIIAIQDLDSRNGTYAGGERIGRVPVIVKSTTRIELGAVVASVLVRTISSANMVKLKSPTRSGRLPSA